MTDIVERLRARIVAIRQTAIAAATPDFRNSTNKRADELEEAVAEITALRARAEAAEKRVAELEAALRTLDNFIDENWGLITNNMYASEIAAVLAKVEAATALAKGGAE